MKRVVTSDLIRNFAEYSDLALTEPIIITRNGRERLVLMNVTEFNYLKNAAALGEDTLRESADAEKPAKAGKDKPARARRA
jgi:PHD/YefM family antitoxin component YafN of YafNO toxin-antitoxin module